VVDSRRTQAAQIGTVVGVPLVLIVLVAAYRGKHVTSHGGQRAGIPTPRSRRSLARGAQIHTNEEGSEHVDISPERDLPSGGSTRRPWPGSETSWRDAPRSAVTLQVLSAMLLVSLGLLLGSTWTIQVLQPKLRRQAEEHRRLNEEWLAVRTARRQRGTCPRCGSPLSERNWYIAPTAVDDQPDDD
jgi:hypothetical protein